LINKVRGQFQVLPTIYQSQIEELQQQSSTSDLKTQIKPNLKQLIGKGGFGEVYYGE